MGNFSTRVCWWLAIIFSAFLFSGCSGGKTTPGKLIRVGGVAMKPCGGGAYCGQINRSLNPANRQSRLISIAFKWYPRTGASIASSNVITVIEGGPGYGATTFPDDYLTMFAPLRGTFDILMVDNRGTGASSVLACTSLDGKPGLPPEAIKQCGTQLGSDAYYYGSDYAADDLVAVMDALKIDQTSLYAVSYGTYFAQVFAGRHPERLLRLVLDSAFPVQETTPFFTSATPTLRRALAQTCARAGGCEGNRDMLPTLLQKLRVKPTQGTAPDSQGNLRRVDLNPGSIFVALMHSSGGLVAYNDFDAAAATYVDNDDSAPLLRLVAEGMSLHDPSSVSADPKDFSKALFLAVSCSDYPKLYSARLTPAERRIVLQTELQAYLKSNPEVYAPFTFEEFRQSGFQENSVDICLDWPQPPLDWEPLVLGKGIEKLRNLPVLVLSGEFDPLTTPQEGAIVARQFPKAQNIVIANTVHAPGLTDPGGCAGTLIADFLAARVLNTKCAASANPTRIVRRFLKTYSAFLAVCGPKSNDALTNIAIATSNDAIARSIFGEKTGHGLRGGTIDYNAEQQDKLTVTLNKVRWVNDVTVSGKIVYSAEKHSTNSNLTIRGPNGSHARIDVNWDVSSSKSAASCDYPSHIG